MMISDRFKASLCHSLCVCKRNVYVLLTVLISFYSPLVVAQKTVKKFIYGINGHPLTQESYVNNIDLQIKLLKDLNSNFYRIDLAIDSNGFVINEAKFLSTVNKLRKNAITVLPVLIFNRNIYNYNNSDEAYRKGLVYGMNFAKRYKNYFDYYEVGNEEGINVIVGPHVDGDIINHYDPAKPKKVMPYFKGVCEAIKKADPNAKIIINEGWVHYGFFDLLKMYKVKYDIIGYHAYSDMGDVNRARKNFGNVLDTLNRKFGKRIWVTEFNVRNGSSLKDDSAQRSWFIRNLKTMHSSKFVDAVFIYELLDQPAFDNPQSPYNNPAEAYYGLVVWSNKYSSTVKKPLFNYYKSFIVNNR